MQQAALAHAADQEEHGETQGGHLLKSQNKLNKKLIISTHRTGNYQELVPGVQVAQERRDRPLISFITQVISCPAPCMVRMISSIPCRAHLGHCHWLGGDSFMPTDFCNSMNHF